MFLGILKYYKARKFLRKNLGQQKITIDETPKISNVACIVNLDEFNDLQALSDFAGALQIPPESFSIIAWTKKPAKHNTITYPLFYFQDINWKLNAKKDPVKTFLDKEYDVLINYFTREKFPLLFLSASVKAGIRIGFKTLDEHYNDIIFKLHISEHDAFKDELLKYLKIMKKL